MEDVDAVVLTAEEARKRLRISRGLIYEAIRRERYRASASGVGS